MEKGGNLLGVHRQQWGTLGDVILFILVFIIIFLLLSFLGELVISASTLGDKDGGLLLHFFFETLMLVAVFASALLLPGMRRMLVSGIGLSLYWRDAVAGLLLAVIIYAAGFGLSLSIGAVEIVSAGISLPSLFGQLAFFLIVAFTEECMMRGFILGRLLKGGINRFAALFLSALLFSVSHLFNPDFAFLPFVNIMLAGMLLGASYIYTRNLTFPIVLHWFWNWLEGTVLGYGVSGNTIGSSLLTLHLPKQDLLNGGNFGFEGSVICTILTFSATVLIVVYYERKPKDTLGATAKCRE